LAHLDELQVGLAELQIIALGFSAAFPVQVTVVAAAAVRYVPS
jgi:hypothetical protein